MEAEYDAIYLMLEQFYAISDRLKQCNGQWAEARGPVFRAPTPENIRAFLQVDSELIKLYKELLRMAIQPRESRDEDGVGGTRIASGEGFAGARRDHVLSLASSASDLAFSPPT
ncbi:hypothetical protein TIFTF001_001454 [Ficus carica]|uniref:Uncharacterized protein n=1 Tax=Ficus carica TaxID=3494 RepID=A0AA87Z6R9_FICCA|nr:hypothetical protein TIFTF001_001454 [Ficus carica]